MARKTMWAVAGALLAFAPLASAATYGLTFQNERVYASELITGPGVEIDYDGDPPELAITLAVDGTEVTDIDEDDVLEVTINLVNAKFGENVKRGDMTIGYTTITGCDATGAEGLEGGTQGESSVTFQVAADADCATAGTFTFTFELPTLEGLNGRAVSATVETAAGGGSGWPGTDGADSDRVCSADSTSARTACTDLTDGVLKRVGAAAANMSQPAEAIITFDDGLTFGPGSGGTRRIDLEGGRQSFEPQRGLGTAAIIGWVSIGVKNASACTTDDPIPEGCTLQSDGSEFSVGRGGEGRGVLKVSATGDFNAGDTLWLEFGGSGPSARETLDMQEDGSMAGEFALSDVVGNARAATGDAGDRDREEGVATRYLIYVPNGANGLRPATFRSRFMVDFDSADVEDKDWAPAPATDFTTSYTVVEAERHAYAIPELGATDEGNVRIKCEVATECMVYLECDDTAGNSRFAQLGDAIDGRSTRTLNAAAIAEELNFGDDGWQGSLSCTVYSTREISVQVLVRSAGTLVNQTYIED